ncbi:hypothetical protein C0Q70_13694 [Pomacea canaliculata]|uniref:PAS domain-containing protein n=1 Tax=Pomacea canaliculata TaxID=400727 RepID=A0A2T7NXZ9_POMCA|nr:hypothetical protein C0Q70_13694 [Pomacea canaliculata]
MFALGIRGNCPDVLGVPVQVDMKTQGDSLYDIVDKRDHGTVQAQLLQGGADLDVTRDVAFFCRMNMSRTLKRQSGFGDVKVIHVRGHFIPLSDPDTDSSDQQQQQQQQKYVFMATCSPLITPEMKENLVQSNTMVFKTVHQLDMTFLEVTKTAEYHLGCSTEEICRKSWYSMLHPEDIHNAREKHILLIRSSHEMGCMITVRMLNADGNVFWVNIVMHVRQATASSQSDEPVIVCINQVISEEEAFQIKVQSHMFTLYPPRSGDMWAAGLPTAQTPGHHHPQTEHGTRWIPATCSSTPPSSSSNYQTPAVSYYGGGQQHPTPPACTYPSVPDRSTGYQVAATQGTVASHGQTEKLKMMLKRKIQGPCRPAKVPKLAWNEHNEGGNGGHGFEFAATGEAMHSPNSASSFLEGGANSGHFNWSDSTQVLSQAHYRVVHALPTSMHQHKVKSFLGPASNSCPQAISPPLSTSGACTMTEQVVPESNGVSLPESYLTPDPSPASSPEPHIPGITNQVKSEIVNYHAATTSAAILQKLEKLASLSHAETSTSPATANAANPASPAVLRTLATPDLAVRKVKEEVQTRRNACIQRELPLMTSFDIESFFDTLDAPEKRLISMHASLFEDKRERQAFNIKNTKSTATPSVKQEHLQAVTQFEHQPSTDSLFPRRESQSRQKNVKPFQQNDMDAAELEELLSFFSSDMNATQLDLSDVLITSSHSNSVGGTSAEGGVALVHCVKEYSDSLQQTGPPCGAGHLGNYLLHSACLERPPEDFSPMSTTDVPSDASSDMSGDEENDAEDLAGESLNLLLQPSLGQLHNSRCKQDRSSAAQGQEEQEQAGLALSCLPGGGRYPHSYSSREVPGLSEEDELYQLDSLFSSLVPTSGTLLLSEETQ